MNLTARNLLLNAVYYLLTLIIPMAMLLWLERYMGWGWSPPPILKGFALLIILAGVTLQCWCIILFQRSGGGTPSPMWPPQRLVVHGPYACCRNPINVGEILVFAGIAACAGSALALLYTLLAAIAFHLFIVYWEEPRHGRLFGESYVNYCGRVARWCPRGCRRQHSTPRETAGHQI